MLTVALGSPPFVPDPLDSVANCICNPVVCAGYIFEKDHSVNRDTFFSPMTTGRKGALVIDP